MVDSMMKSFDIWTEAQGVKSKGRVKSIENISHEGIARLRGLILELAIRGKLVAQDPNDEPAGDLLKKIEEEKKRLIKGGKLKSQGVYSQVLENEKKFALPNGWEFVRFGNVTFNRDAERIPLSVEERQGRQGQFDYYGASGVIDNIDQYIFDKPLLLIGEDGANLVNRSTPIAFIAKGKYWVNNHAHVIDGVSENFLNYLCLHINAISLLPYITGTAQPKMNQAKMNSIVLALPPLAEQHRIVAKVDSLMALCDQLEKEQTNHLKTHQALVKTLLQTLTQAQDADSLHEAWQRMSGHFDTLFCTEDSIDQLKQTILQLAIMGRLVKQDPNDEPASELIKRIAKEKDKLIKEGKIKKEQPLPNIMDDEKPFDLPKGWKWVRLGEVALFSEAGKSFLCEDRQAQVGEWGIIKMSAISSGTFKEDQNKFFSKTLAQGQNLRIKADDLLFARASGSRDLTGTSCVVKVIHGNLLLNDKSIRFRLSNYINVDYINSWNNSAMSRNYYNGIIGSKTTTMNNITRQQFSHLPIPLAPLAEQNRIVLKVDKLFALCDSLKTKIENARELKVSLSKTIVENAVA